MLRVRAIWAGPSAPLLSTFYFTPLQGSNLSTDATNAHIAVATFLNSVRGVVADDFSYSVSPIVDNIGVDGVLVGRVTAANSASASGTDAADPLPFQTQGQIKWSTGAFQGGREVIGKTYVPGPTEGQNIAGAPGSSYQTVLQNAANALIASSNTIFVIWSRAHSLADEVDAALAQPAWRVLRSRR